MSPAHRMCSTPGCGGPAVWGSLCWNCAHETGVDKCNVLVLNHSAIPFRRPEHVSAHDFQGAIDRALGR